MKKSWRILGSLALVSLLAYRLDWNEVGQAFTRLDGRFWLLGVGLYLVCQTLSTVRWYLLAQPLGLIASWSKYFAFYFIGMFFNLALPTSVGGDAVRAWYAASVGNDELPLGRRTSAIVSVLTDRITGLFMLIVLACVASLFGSFPLPHWIQVGVVCLGLAALSGPLVLYFARRLMMEGFASSESKSVVHSRRLLDAFWFYRNHLGRLAVTLVLSGIIQVVNAGVVWTIALGLGLPLPLAHCCLVVPLVTLLTMVPISLNGMGLREAGFALMLAPLGIGESQAITLGFLTFVAVAVSSLPGLAIYLLGNFPQYRDANPETDSDLLEESTPLHSSKENTFDDHFVSRGSDQRRTGQPPAAA